MLLKRNIALDNHQTNQLTSPLPIILSGATAFRERTRRREGRGDGSFTFVNCYFTKRIPPYLNRTTKGKSKHYLLFAWIKYQLRTPEQRDRLPAGFIDHFGIPDLSGPSAVEACGNAGNSTLAGGAEEITL